MSIRHLIKVFAALICLLVLTTGTLFAQARNAFGLPYDPVATIYEITGSIHIEDIWVTQDSNYGSICFMDGEGWLRGEYDYKNQVWYRYDDHVLELFDITQFFESVDLSKTDLNRDYEGNPVKPGTQAATITASNSFFSAKNQNLSINFRGLPYDPNAAIFNFSQYMINVGDIEVLPNSGFLQFIYNDVVYVYDYENQYWMEYNDHILDTIDISQFFRSLDFEKIEPNRDMDGNPLKLGANAKRTTAAALALFPEVASQESGEVANKFGLAYDPDAVVDFSKNGTSIIYGNAFVACFYGTPEWYEYGARAAKNSISINQFTPDYEITDDNELAEWYCRNWVNPSEGQTGIYFFSVLYKELRAVYDYENQCWLFNVDTALTPKTIEYFYASIDLSKTDLNRDRWGRHSEYEKPAILPDTPTFMPPGTDNSIKRVTSTAPGSIVLLGDDCGYGSFVTQNKKLIELDERVSKQLNQDVRQVNFTKPSSTNGVLFRPAKKPASRADYSRIDRYIGNLNIPTSIPIETAVKTITRTAWTDKEKAYAIFAWIHKNIQYDFNSVDPDLTNTTEARTAAGTYQNRLGVCEGYSLLYQQMCLEVGLYADYIQGYAKKSVSYTIGDSIEGHAWNCVYADDEAILVDSTWGWFDVDPAYMVFSHFPDQSRFQKLSTSLSLDQWLQLPYIEPQFEDFGIDGAELLEFMWSHTRAWRPDDISASSRRRYISMTDSQNSGYKRTDISLLGDTTTEAFFFYDDNAELISELKNGICKYKSWNVKAENLGAEIYFYKDDERYPSAIYNVTYQYWYLRNGHCVPPYYTLDWYTFSNTAEFNEDPSCIKRFFAKIDPSVPLERDHDIVEADTIISVPVSRKAEVVAAVNNYDWKKDKDFCDFVEWMIERDTPESLIEYYIVNAKDPSTRGFVAPNNASDRGGLDGGILFHNSYDFPSVSNDLCLLEPFRAGGMELSFQTRKLYTHTICQQETTPVLIAHFVDTDGSEVTVNPQYDMQERAALLEERYNSVMPNKIECYCVTVPLSYNDWMEAQSDGFSWRRDFSAWEKEQVLSSLRTSNPVLAKKLAGKEFGIIHWFDRAMVLPNGVGFDFSTVRTEDPWVLWTAFTEFIELPAGTSTHVDWKQPGCLNNDCEHGVNASVCPLCLYERGF